MKSVTEFWSVNLNKGIKAKADLVAGGKTPEEIQQSLGETFKLEGDKLKYFVNAIEVAGQNLDKLARVLVVSLNEGETAPPKSTKIDEMTYIPEFQTDPRPVNTQKSVNRGGTTNKGKRKDGPKESPWGLSPEQKAAKKGGGAGKSKPQ